MEGENVHLRGNSELMNDQDQLPLFPVTEPPGAGKRPPLPLPKWDTTAESLRWVRRVLGEPKQPKNDSPIDYNEAAERQREREG